MKIDYSQDFNYFLTKFLNCPDSQLKKTVCLHFTISRYQKCLPTYMAIFVFIAALIGVILQSPLLNLLAGQIDFLNSICLSLIPNSLYSDLPKSLICGSKLHDIPLKNALKSTGLIHLVVISGAHLLVLESFIASLKKTNRQSNLILGALLIYVLISGAHPPAVRSWLAILLRSQNDFYKMNWSPTKLSLLSGLFALTLQPLWLSSLSLTLSWSAALSLAAFRQYLPRLSSFKKQSLMFLTMTLPLLPLGLPHPLTIFTNCFIAPLLSHVLFPLSFVYLLLPDYVAPVFHWSQTHIIEFSRHIPTPLSPVALPTDWFLIYPLSLYLLSLCLQKRRYL